MAAALTKDRHNWGFAAGRVSVLEGRLTTYDFFMSLVNLEHTEEVFHRLQDTALKEWIVPGITTWEDWSTVIDNYYHDVVNSLWRDTPAADLPNIFLLAEDYMNLKRALLNMGTYTFPTSLFTESRLAEVAAGDPSLLPDVLRPSVAMLSSMSGSADASAFLMDVALDGAYLRHMLSVGARLEAPVIDGWLSERMLGRAIVLIWRALQARRPLKQYQQHFLPIGPYDAVLAELISAGDPRSWEGLIPGRVGDLWMEARQKEEGEQIAEFERLMSNYLTELARQGRLQTAGPERVTGYMWGLLVETFNFKLTISGLLNKIDRDLLRPRMRECYV